MTESAGDYGADVTLGYGAALYDHVCKRLEAIRDLGEPGFVLPERIVQRPDNAVVATYPPHTALTLDEALDRHGPFSAGECVWWASEAARLLSLLHRNGLVHANLTASAVLFDGQGLRLSSLVEPTQAVDSMTAGTDIQALGRLLELSVKVEDAHRIGAWSEPMTSALDSARPTAAMVARALMSCAPPQAVVFEHGGLAQHLRDDALRSHEVGSASVNGTGAGVPLMSHVFDRVVGHWLPRLREVTAPRPHKRTLGLVALALGSCAVALVVLPMLLHSGGAGASAASGMRGAESFAPEQAAAQLTKTRVESLAVASELGLLSVSAPTSAIRAIDLTRVLELRNGSGTADQVVEVLDVHKATSPPGLTEQEQPRLWVSVTYSLTATDGTDTAVTESVVLLLGRDGSGHWDVLAALPEV